MNNSITPLKQNFQPLNIHKQYYKKIRQKKASKSPLPKIMKNRYSINLAQKNATNKLDIKQMQRNLKNMKKQMYNFMNKEKERYGDLSVAKTQLPVIVVQSKLLRCCENQNLGRNSRSYEVIDRLMKLSSDKRKNGDEEKAKKAAEDTAKTNKKAPNYANQIKLKNSVRKIRKQMNLYQSQLVSLRDSIKTLKKKQDLVNLDQHNDKNSPNKDKQRLSPELSVKKLKKKNDRSLRKHSKKFTNILDLINRKVVSSSMDKRFTELEKVLEKRTPRLRSRSRFYSESHCEGLTHLENGLMEHAQHCKSVMMDYRAEMIKKQKQINKNKASIPHCTQIMDEPLKSYIDMQRYVLILDKNKTLLKKAKPNLKINPITPALTKRNSPDKNKTQKDPNPQTQPQPQFQFTPWQDKSKDAFNLDFEDSLPETFQNTPQKFPNQQ